MVCYGKNLRKNNKMNNNNNNLGFTNKQDGLCSICMLFTHTWKDEGNPGNAPTIFYWRVDCQIGHQSSNNNKKSLKKNLFFL